MVLWLSKFMFRLAPIWYFTSIFLMHVFMDYRGISSTKVNSPNASWRCERVIGTSSVDIGFPAEWLRDGNHKKMSRRKSPNFFFEGALIGLYCKCLTLCWQIPSNFPAWICRFCVIVLYFYHGKSPLIICTTILGECFGTCSKHHGQVNPSFECFGHPKRVSGLEISAVKVSETYHLWL